MSAQTAAYACNNLLNVKTLIPMHYDTFPLLDDDLDTLQQDIKQTEIFIPKISEQFQL
jgi:L-ascorbate metabolism protein UlaG (beta-lactamase superfamily)